MVPSFVPRGRPVFACWVLRFCSRVCRLPRVVDPPPVHLASYKLQCPYSLSSRCRALPRCTILPRPLPFLASLRARGAIIINARPYLYTVIWSWIYFSFLCCWFLFLRSCSVLFFGLACLLVGPRLSTYLISLYLWLHVHVQYIHAPFMSVSVFRHGCVCAYNCTCYCRIVSPFCSSLLSFFL